MASSVYEESMDHWAAVRNKSFPERPAFGEPLIRHYFCFCHLADLCVTLSDVCFKGIADIAAKLLTRDEAR